MTHKYIELTKHINQKNELKYKLEALFSEIEFFFFIRVLLISLFLGLFFIPLLSFCFTYFSLPPESSFTFSYFDFFLNLDVLFNDGFEKNFDLFMKFFLGIGVIVYTAYFFYLKKKTQKKTLIVVVLSFNFFLINFGLFVNFLKYESFGDLNILFIALLVLFACCDFLYFYNIKKLKKADKNATLKGFQESFKKELQLLDSERIETKKDLFESKNGMLLFYEMAKKPSTSEVDQEIISTLFKEYDSYQKDKNKIDDNLSEFERILNTHNKHFFNINNE